MNDDAWEVVEVLPTLMVDDLDRAVTYYEALGFERDWSYPSDEEDPTHVGLDFGPVHLMLSLCHDPPSEIPRQNLYFVLESLSAYHQRLRSALGDDVPEIVDSDYGMRDVSLQDPWGHLLTFGESC